MRWFPNRWPAMPDERCEVILYTPEHDATLWSLGPDAVRARSSTSGPSEASELGAREDVAYVLVFENRGAEVGATITHPHGQIYAFDFVPAVPLRELERGRPFDEPGRAARGDERRLARVGARMRRSFRIALLLVPDEPVPDLPSLDDAGRDGLAEILVDVLERLDRLFAAQTPYMLWIHQRPFDGGDWPASAAARRDRLALACPARAPLHRRRRARLWCLLQPGRARGGRGVASRGGAAGQSMTSALDRLLYLGGQPSWESAGAPEPEPAACPGDARLVSDAGGRGRARPARTPWRRSLDGAWDFRLVDRPARGGEPRPGRARLGPGRRARPVDDAGVRAAALHERRDAVPRASAARAGGEPDRDLPPAVHRSARLARSPRRPRLRRRRGRAPRARERRARSASRRTPGHRPSSTSPTLVRHRGPNELVAVVVRWSDASFVEDQDQWWHAGISREVYLRSDRIEDVFVTATLDDDYRHGTLSVSAVADAPLEARLLDARGRVRARRRPAHRRSKCARRASGRPRVPRSTRSSSSVEAGRALPAASGFRRVEIRDRRLLVNGKPIMILRRQPPRARRRPRARRLARARWSRTCG